MLMNGDFSTIPRPEVFVSQQNEGMALEIGPQSSSQPQAHQAMGMYITCSILLVSQHYSLVQGLKRAGWQDLQYKGDWMRRPLSSSEVPWLVRILLYLSDAFNAHFQLDHPLPQDSQASVSNPEICFC